MIKKIKASDTLYIRQKVLWPNKPINELKLDLDELGHHFGYFKDGTLVTVISVFITDCTAQFRKFATIETEQGKGYGTLLLEYVFKQLKNEKVDTVWCNARKTAIHYYKRFDMSVVDDSNFLKGDIEYVIMKKRI